MLEGRLHAEIGLIESQDRSVKLTWLVVAKKGEEENLLEWNKGEER